MENIHNTAHDILNPPLDRGTLDHGSARAKTTSSRAEPMPHMDDGNDKSGRIKIENADRIKDADCIKDAAHAGNIRDVNHAKGKDKRMNIDRIDVDARWTLQNIDQLNQKYKHADAAEILRITISPPFRGRSALISSFGTQSAILLHMIAQMDKDFPLLFIDTGKHFPETLAYRDLLEERFALTNIQAIKPATRDIASRDDKGLRWSYDPDGCCAIRKVAPLQAALSQKGYIASITGRKGHQAKTREAVPIFEIDDQSMGDRIKINPLIHWTNDDIDAYFEHHNLPQHPLVEAGYPSIGCAPCTSKVRPGEDPRAGRWRGWNKTECGIHSPASSTEDNGANDPIF